jgi:hypothetical protein
MTGMERLKAVLFDPSHLHAVLIIVFLNAAVQVYAVATGSPVNYEYLSFAVTFCYAASCLISWTQLPD